MLTENEILFALLWLLCLLSLACSTMMYYWCYDLFKKVFGKNFPKIMIMINLLGIMLCLIILFSFNE